MGQFTFVPNRLITTNRPDPNSRVTSRHFGLGQGGDTGVHIEIEPAIGVHVLPDQRRQRMQISGDSARLRRFAPNRRAISSSVRNLIVSVGEWATASA